MSKLVILGDTHLGARNASNHFSQHFNKFFTDVFYPYLIEHNIKTIFQLGDVFDSRTILSIKAYNASKSKWFDPLRKNGITMHMLLGNHDIYHKHSLKINAPNLFLANEYIDNIHVHSSPCVVEVDNTTFAMIPWICDENREEIFDFLKQDHIADLCLGHFEIAGFNMNKTQISHGGLPRDIFDKFELTLSGHYHTRSVDTYNRITYVGIPYEITFSDMHDPKGFHVFDTETRELEFIKNPNTMFDRIIYSDGWSGDIQTVKNKIIKLVVEKKTDLYAFDRFIDSIKLAGVYELQIIENFDDLKSVEIGELSEVEDTLMTINSYVDELSTAVDKEKLKTYLNGIYQESIAQ